MLKIYNHQQLTSVISSILPYSSSIIILEPIPDKFLIIILISFELYFFLKRVILLFSKDVNFLFIIRVIPNYIIFNLSIQRDLAEFSYFNDSGCLKANIISSEPRLYIISSSLSYLKASITCALLMVSFIFPCWLEEILP